MAFVSFWRACRFLTICSLRFWQHCMFTAPEDSGKNRGLGPSKAFPETHGWRTGGTGLVLATQVSSFISPSPRSASLVFLFDVLSGKELRHWTKQRNGFIHERRKSYHSRRIAVHRAAFMWRTWEVRWRDVVVLYACLCAGNGRYTVKSRRDIERPRDAWS